MMEQLDPLIRRIHALADFLESTPKPPLIFLPFAEETGEPPETLAEWDSTELRDRLNNIHELGKGRDDWPPLPSSEANATYEAYLALQRLGDDSVKYDTQGNPNYSVVFSRPKQEYIEILRAVPSIEMEKPTWDKATRELRYRGRLCKCFVRRANNQWEVLSSFEELDWRYRIDDPVSQPGNLKDTLRDLNRGMKHLVFRADGTGEGVLWSSAKT